MGIDFHLRLVLLLEVCTLVAPLLPLLQKSFRPQFPPGRNNALQSDAIDIRLGLLVFLDHAQQSSRASVCADCPFQSLQEQTSRSKSCNRFWARDPEDGHWIEFNDDATFTVYHDQFARKQPFTVCIRDKADVSPNSLPPGAPARSRSPVQVVAQSMPVQTVLFRCATVPEAFLPHTTTAQLVHAPLAISIADLRAGADIWTRIKRYVLQHSIMKGKIVLLESPLFRSFSSLAALLEDCRTSTWLHVPIVEFQIHLEFEHAPLSDLLTHLDRLRQRAKQLQLPLFDQRSIEELAWTSDVIEGSTIPKRNVASIAAAVKERLGDTVEPSVDSDAVFELKNHLTTIDQTVTLFASTADDAIDGGLACRLHRQLALINVHPEERGRYRSVNVTIMSVPDPHFSHHENIPGDMAAVADWLSLQAQPNDIGVIAQHHYRWVQVHPFIDGNGRVARLITNCLALRAGWPMFVIHPSVRELYFLALRAVRRGDLKAELLTRLFAESLLRSFEIMFARAGVQ